MLDALRPVFKRWEETQAALVQAVAELPRDRLHWRPAPHATTPAEIIAHIARAEATYARMCGDPNERDAAVPETWDAAVAMLERSAAIVRALFERLTAAELAVTRAEHWGPLGPRVEGPLDTVWFLEQMTRHQAYHLGQINYLALMLEEAPPAPPGEH